jgi:hypothetical protein
MVPFPTPPGPDTTKIDDVTGDCDAVATYLVS